MRRVMAVALVVVLSGCSVASKSGNQERAFSVGRGCAAIVDSSSAYLVACSSIDPQKVISAIETAKAAKQ